MKIRNVRIKNFRSILDMSLNFDDINVIVGPNSAGKSNVLRAIKDAFAKNLDRDRVYSNLPAELRDTQGAPRLSSYVDFTLEGLPVELLELLDLADDEPVKYSFRAYRSGTITRKLANTDLDEKFDFGDYINIIQVPAIRDLAAGGLEPFRKLFAQAIARGRGPNNLATLGAEVARTIQDRGAQVLNYQSGLANQLIGIDQLSIDADAINLDRVYETLHLMVDRGGKKLPLESLGTGHQSAVIMNFFRQLGEADEQHTIFLFEEPDNHLHPTSIRAIAEELRAVSKTAQVILTSHSPVLVDHFGLEKVSAINVSTTDLGTKLRKFQFEEGDSQKLRAQLRQFGLRATEPLFCKSVIVVEGPSDAVVISQFLEHKLGQPMLHSDVLVIPAGGKGSVRDLCELLSKMDVKWYAILDNDAAWTADLPITAGNRDQEEINELVRAVEALSAALNSNTRVGRYSRKNLGKIRLELEEGPPERAAFKGTPLEAIVKLSRKLNRQDRADLHSALEGDRKTRYRELLARANIWIWSSGSLEEALISSPSGRDEIREFIRLNGSLQGRQLDEANDDVLCSYLKKLLTKPELAIRFVDSGFENRLFSRSEMNRMYNWLLQDLAN